ncbi:MULTISPECIES: hypothetical protein [Massilia]|uniref:hypothetical protein n=1 Tax=Massilia TaxID=149698 RepID=UPI001420149F|nr:MULTISPECIES: hypothetical protein [Massilia]NHZ98335.1 hypothetical protein [Massilia sp. CCM 8734]
MQFMKKYCEKHGEHLFVWTSPRLAEAIANSRPVPHEEIRHLHWNYAGRDSDRVVDAAYLVNLGIPANDAVVVLKDRDEQMKQLNDRLLIMRIRKELQRVCPFCLDRMVHPA